MKESRQKKVDWSDLLKNERDKISIEHIYPQSTTTYWREAFSDITKKEQNIYNGSLGNLLLLSFAINSSLQNDSFEEKKSPKYDSSGKKIRNGYSDGSHSEIEVSRHRKWGPTQIQNRSLELLEFMEERWDIKIKNKSEKMQLLQFTSD